MSLNNEFKIDFVHEGYFTKTYIIDTKNVPETNQKIELSLKVDLIEKNELLEDSIANLPFDIIKYDVNKGYFDTYKPITTSIKEDKKQEIQLAKNKLKLDKLNATTTADSLSILEQESKIIAAENELLFAEKELEIAKSQLEAQSLQLKQEATKRYLLFGGIGIAILFIAILFMSIRRKKKDNELILKQKDTIENAHTQLEEKNREIIDSISYAKRIQSAILPPNKIVKEYLVNSFIVYEPKDIVAGDFYWMTQQKNKIIFAAADCTGHGVPGALVSVICNNALNRSVREYGLTEPAKILDKTREIFIQEFEKADEDVKDGMDIALCSLEGNTLEYAGALNPLWIIRNGEIIEVKASKQPIGKFDNIKPYTNHSINLQKGDTFYIFSDGYSDQFGGEKGKKYKSTNFKKLLLSIQKENMETQKKIIENTFKNWMGDLEQLDDVCIIGVRV